MHLEIMVYIMVPLGENAYNDIANSIHVDSINNKIYVIGDMEI